VDIVVDFSVSLCSTANKSQYFRTAACISQFFRNSQIFKKNLLVAGGGGNLCVHLVHNLL